MNGNQKVSHEYRNTYIFLHIPLSHLTPTDFECSSSSQTHLVFLCKESVHKRKIISDTILQRSQTDFWSERILLHMLAGGVLISGVYIIGFGLKYSPQGRNLLPVYRIVIIHILAYALHRSVGSLSRMCLGEFLPRMHFYEGWNLKAPSLEENCECISNWSTSNVSSLEK